MFLGLSNQNLGGLGDAPGPRYGACIRINPFTGMTEGYACPNASPEGPGADFRFRDSARQSHRSRRGVYGLGEDKKSPIADLFDLILWNMPLPKSFGNWEPYKDDYGSIRWLNKYTNADISDTVFRSMKYSKNMSGLGAGQGEKFADILDSLSHGLRKDNDWTNLFCTRNPIQNIVVYGVLAFGAYKLIEKVVKR